MSSGDVSDSGKWDGLNATRCGKSSLTSLTYSLVVTVVNGTVYAMGVASQVSSGDMNGGGDVGV